MEITKSPKESWCIIPSDLWRGLADAWVNSEG